MTIGQYIQTQSSSVLDANTLACSITTVPGSTLVVIVSMNLFYGDVTVSSVVDTASNAGWVIGPTSATASGSFLPDTSRVTILYCPNAAAVTSITTNFSGTPSATGLFVFELPSSQPFDASGTGASSNTTSFNQSITTTNQYDTVIYAGVMGNESSRNNLTSSETEALTKQNVIYTGNATAGVQMIPIIEARSVAGAASKTFASPATTYNHVTAGVSFKMPQPSSLIVNDRAISRASRW